MTQREVWVHVPLRDGQTLGGMLVHRDADRIVLRQPYWVWRSLTVEPDEFGQRPRPEVEHLPTHVYDRVEVDAEEACMVYDFEKDPDQKYDIVEWPPRKQVLNPRYQPGGLPTYTLRSHPSVVYVPPEQTPEDFMPAALLVGARS